MSKMLLKEQLNNALNEKYLAAIKILSGFSDLININSYIIGGVARDLIMQKPIYDLDIVVEGNAIEFCQKAEKEGLCQICRISEDFGTAKVTFFDELEIDIASTRTEKYPNPGHLPVVDKIGCSLKEDILRRDFTVNTLAISINASTFGEVTDFLGGAEDIEKRQLKILHDKSFIDDPTRIIRALRFEQKLGFSIEPHTNELCKEYLNNFNSNDICYERIKQVVKLAFNLDSSELFNKVLNNEIYKLITRNPRNADGQNIEHAITKNLNKIDIHNVWLIYLACLTASEDTQKLNLTAKEQLILTSLDDLLQRNTFPKTNFEIYNFFKGMPQESIISYIGLKNSSQAQIYLDELQDTRTIINGKDLINMGFKEGEKIGHALNIILEARLNKTISTKDEELELAKKFLNFNN